MPGDIHSTLSQAQVLPIDFRIRQQTDGHNCGIWALENASYLNRLLKESKPFHEIISQLKDYQRSERYFEERRQYFAGKLARDEERQARQPVRGLSREDKLLKNGELFNAIRNNKPLKEKLEKVKKHLDEVANVNARDANDKHNTPLDVAVLKDVAELVTLLLEYRADSTIENDDHETPFTMLERLDQYPITVQLNQAKSSAINRPSVANNPSEDGDSKKTRIEAPTAIREPHVVKRALIQAHESESSQSKRLKSSPLNKPEEYSASGLKLTLHGRDKARQARQPMRELSRYESSDTRILVDNYPSVSAMGFCGSGNVVENINVIGQETTNIYNQINAAGEGKNSQPMPFNDIAELGIDFEEDFIGLKNFFSGEQQVFHLTSQEDSLLGLIAVVKIFDSKKNEIGIYAKDNGHIFSKLGWLINKNNSGNQLEDFKRSEKKNLLVVRCNYPASSSVDEGGLNTLLQELWGILRSKNNANKKIIFISKTGKLEEKRIHAFFMDESRQHKYILASADKVKFSDLDYNVQEKIRQKKVIFQGQKVELGNLIDIRSGGDLSKEEINRLDNIITPKALLDLITQDTVLGSEPLQLSDLEAAYARRYREIPEQNLVNALLENSVTPVLFMISGIGKEKSEIADEFIRRLNIDNEQDKETIKGYISLWQDSSEYKKIIIVTNQDDEGNLKRFRRLCHDNPRKRVHWIKVTNNQFHWQQLYDPAFYMGRQFNYQDKTVIQKDIGYNLSQKNPSDLCIFSNIDQRGVAALLRIYERTKEEKISKERFGKNTFASLDKNDVKEIFKQWCSIHSNKPLHWLEVQHSQLVWQRSYLSFKGLRQYVDKDNTQQAGIDETQFSHISDKAVIIADEPGMGKSTTLTRLSDQKLESAWVIRMNLKDCREAIANLPGRDKQQWLTLEEVIKFLSTVERESLDSPLAQGLLQYNLQYTTLRTLLILFDGFDEINEEQQEKIIPLLQFLKEETPASVWVTTRFNKMEDLENRLSVFAITFKELSPTEREKFLKEFWQVRLRLTLSQDDYKKIFGPEERKDIPKDKSEPTKFEQYAKALLDKANNVLGETIAHFMGVPLQMRLLAEGFLPEFEAFIALPSGASVPDFETIDVPDIYRRFIKVKYDLYFKEKTGLSAGFSTVSKSWFTELLTKRHQRLAFQVLFADETKDFLEVKSPFLAGDEDFTVNLEEEIELRRVGIIHSTQHNSKFEFIHRTFAEYFTADLLVSWLRKPAGHPKHRPVQKLLLERILVKPEYQVVRLFFNGQVGQATLPVSTLTLYGKQVAKSKVKNRRSFGEYKEGDRIALHVAAEEGHAAIINFLLDSLKEHPDSLKKFLFIREVRSQFLPQRTGNRPLDLAVANGRAQAVAYLLGYVKDDYETLQELMVNASGNNHLRIAAEKGYFEVVKILLSYLQNYPRILEQLFGAPNYSDTALHVAFQNKHFEIVKLLVGSVAGYPEMHKSLYDIQENLQLAANNEARLQLASSNKNTVTRLHKEIEDGNAQAVQELLNSVKDDPDIFQAIVVAPYGDDQVTALHQAADKGHVAVVQQLLDSAKEYPGTFKILVLARANREETALHLAASKGHTAVVQQLLNSVQEHPGILKSLDFMTNLDVVLYVAAEEGHSKIVQQLLDSVKKYHDIFRRIVLNSRESVLFRAAEEGHSNIVQQLLDSVKEYPDIFRRIVLDSGETVLHRAAEEGHVEVVQQLLNSVQEYPETFRRFVLATHARETALHRAAENGYVGVIQQLLNSVKEYSGLLQHFVIATSLRGTALHLTAQNGHVEVVQQLLDSVKEYPETFQQLVLATNRHKQTALQVAYTGGHIELAELLLRNVENYPETYRDLLDDRESSQLEADNQERLQPADSDKDKAAGLHKEADAGNIQAVQELLDSLKDNPHTLHAIIVADDYEGTALHQATAKGHVKIVQQLLDSIKDYPETLKTLLLATTRGGWRNDIGGTVLHWAARRGYVAIVQQLLDSVKKYPRTLKSLVIATNQLEKTALYVAAEYGRSKIIQQLLDSVKEYPGTCQNLVLATNKYERTVLHQAVQDGHIEVFQQLFNFAKENLPETLNALVLAIDKSGDNALQRGIEKGHAGVVQQLLDSVKEYPETFQNLVLSRNNDYRTALYLAIEKGKVKAFSILLNELKSQIDIFKKAVLETLVVSEEDKVDLYNAAEKSKKGTISAFLNNLKDHLDILQQFVLQADKDNRTALHWAAEKGYKEIVDILLDNLKDNSDILQKLILWVDKDNRNALHWAAEKGYKEIVEALLNSLKDQPQNLEVLVLGEDNFCNTPLDCAVENNRQVVIDVLVSALNNNINVIYEFFLYHNNFDEANINRNSKRVTALLQAFKNYPTTLYTMLHWATDKNNVPIIKAILDSLKGDPTTLKDVILATDEDGKVALYLAVEKGYSKAIQQLLDSVKGYSEILKDLVLLPQRERGHTVLHLATWHGYTEVVQQLLDNIAAYPDILQALVLAIDHGGFTVLHWAAIRRHVAIVKLLLARMKDISEAALQKLISAHNNYGATAQDYVRENNAITFRRRV